MFEELCISSRAMHKVVSTRYTMCACTIWLITWSEALQENQFHWYILFDLQAALRPSLVSFVSLLLQLQPEQRKKESKAISRNNFLLSLPERTTHTHTHTEPAQNDVTAVLFSQSTVCGSLDPWAETLLRPWRDDEHTGLYEILVTLTQCWLVEATSESCSSS
jgi:hypothetical protein